MFRRVQNWNPCCLLLQGEKSVKKDSPSPHAGHRQRKRCKDSGASRAYMRGADPGQWLAYPPKRSGLSGSVLSAPKTGGSMLSVTGRNRFYYLHDFTDMRCKHSRVLSVIREQLHRFTGIFNGCRDFLSLTPQNMNLAVCQ